MTPLSGALSESPACYLLQVDEFRFLLDCGWDEMFSQSFIKELVKHCKQIDAVLLSQPDSQHLGLHSFFILYNCCRYLSII